MKKIKAAWKWLNTVDTVCGETPLVSFVTGIMFLASFMSLCYVLILFAFWMGMGQ